MAPGYVSGMILYKYMSVSSALATLETNSVGFSRPSFFNDPFDTPLAVPVPTTDPISEMFADIGAWGKSHIWEERSAILSLTRTPSNSLMWAHYADHHRGAVLALDTSAAGLLDPNCNMIPAHFGSVIYTRHRPSGPFHSTFTEGIAVGATHHFVLSHYEKWQRLFLTKPIEWAYEEEVRVVKCLHGINATSGEGTNPSGTFTVVEHQGRPLHCFRLLPGSIKAVYAGARATTDSLNALTHAAGPISVTQAKLDQSSYAVSVEPL